MLVFALYVVPWCHLPARDRYPAMSSGNFFTIKRRSCSESSREGWQNFHLVEVEAGQSCGGPGGPGGKTPSLRKFIIQSLKPFSRENGRFWDLSDLPQHFGKTKNKFYPCLRFSTMDVRQSRLVPTNRPLALLTSFAEKLIFKAKYWNTSNVTLVWFIWKISKEKSHLPWSRLDMSRLSGTDLSGWSQARHSNIILHPGKQWIEKVDF